jgi:hypothetical protein
LFGRPVRRALGRKPHPFQNPARRRYADPLVEFLEDDVSNHPAGPKRELEAVILRRPFGDDSQKLLFHVFLHGPIAPGQGTALQGVPSALFVAAQPVVSAGTMKSESRDDVFGAFSFLFDKPHRSFSQLFAGGAIQFSSIKVCFHNGLSVTYVGLKLNSLISSNSCFPMILEQHPIAPVKREGKDLRINTKI